MVLHSDAIEELFWFHKEPLSQRFFKEPYFPYFYYNMKDLFET